MRRALRWLCRQFYKVALSGAFIAGAVTFLLAAPPATAFAEKPPAISAAASAPTPGDEESPQEQARAKQRAREGRLLLLASLVYQGALLGGFLLAGGTRWLARLTARFAGRWVLALGAVAGIVVLGMGLLSLPLDFYSGFIFPHRYGLSNQTALQWLRDYLVGAGVGAVIGFPVLTLVYYLFRRAPRTWWLWFAAASAPIAIFIMIIQPVFVEPLFNKFTPLTDLELRRELLAMAHQQRIPAEDVFQVDASRQSNAVNAYVNGFGPTQRIVLYDTLLNNFSHDEIRFVLAHEMGHYVLGHIRRGIIVSILAALAGGFLFYLTIGGVLRRFSGALGVTALGNPASYPLLLAVGLVFSTLALPIGNAFSRQIEWEADRYAMKIDPNFDAGISAYHKLARYNVAEEDPPRWVELTLYSHPSLAHRIAALEQAREKER